MVPKNLFLGLLISYRFWPQHFLNLRPVPQGQESFRPIFGSIRVTGI